MYIHRGYMLYTVDVICPQILLHYQHTFPPSRKSFYAGRTKLFAEASGLLTTAVFHLVFVRKRRPRNSSFRGQKRLKSGVTKSEL